MIQQNVLDGIKIKNKIYKIQGFSCAFGNKSCPRNHIAKEEVYTSSFFVSIIPLNAPKTVGFVFYFDGRTPL